MQRSDAGVVPSARDEESIDSGAPPQPPQPAAPGRSGEPSSPPAPDAESPRPASSSEGSPDTPPPESDATRPPAAGAFPLDDEAFSSAPSLTSERGSAPTAELAPEGDDSFAAVSGEEDDGRAELFGHFAIETRLFALSPNLPEQPRYHNVSLAFEPGYVCPLSNQFVFKAEGFVRLDEHDSRRSHFDVRQALAELTAGSLRLTLGINKVFWGVTESRHLIDIVNQSDYLEDFDGEEKFGQLMAMATFDMDDAGTLDLMAMSWFRPQRYPGVQSRPGVPLAVLDDAPIYDSEVKRWNIDLAMRWSHSVGGFDWAVMYFRGTSREPQLLPVVTSDGVALQPEYDLIHQGGLALQWTTGAWLLKLEAMARQGQGPTFFATTAGFEYTLSGMFGPIDLGIVAEHNYDGRDNATFNIYDNDLFGGIRLSLNDEGSSQLLLGALTDLESGVTLASAEISRRLGTNWKLALDARAFIARDDADPLYWFRRDHYAQATIEYHF